MKCEEAVGGTTYLLHNGSTSEQGLRVEVEKKRIHSESECESAKSETYEDPKGGD